MASLNGSPLVLWDIDQTLITNHSSGELFPESHGGTVLPAGREPIVELHG